MANRKKSSKSAKPNADKAETEKPVEEVTDAVVASEDVTDPSGEAPSNTDESQIDPAIEATAAEQDATQEDASHEAAAADSDADTADAAENTIAEGTSETEGDDPTADALEDTENEHIEPEPEAIEKPERVAPTPVHAQDPPGGFVPMVLGGLVAAGIGFAVARFVLPDAGTDPAVLNDLRQKIEGQVGTVTKLSERVDAIEAGGDTSGLEAAQSDLQATLDTALGEMADRISALEAEIADIDRQPATGPAPDVDLSAYEKELQDLQATVDAMAENAALIEKNAQAAAKATLQRAALTRISTALDAGAGFESAVADLQDLGVTVPDALVAASAGGVAPLSTLQESFPDAARTALAASRDAGGASDGSGLRSFLRSQLGARSLQPREGNDPDAVLSRIEAAVREGRLADALAEIEALPEEGRAELSDWSSQVALRQNAVTAAQDLGAELN